MDKISFKEFKQIYLPFVEEIYKFWNEEMQVKVSSNNIAWGPPYSFKSYLEKSAIRFYNAYLEIPDGATTVCDIGGFWGVYPLTLKKLGYDVTMTEVKKFYDQSFDPLFDFIESNGVKILDINPFEESLKENAYDYISIMAVLEHIPDSIKGFLDRLSSWLKQGGAVYIDVPNVAYYFKRRDLLFGKSPLPDIMNIYNSREPFIGHHHEYTRDELIRVMQAANFAVKNIYRFNYSISTDLKFSVKHPMATLAMTCFPDTREVVGASFTVEHK